MALAVSNQKRDIKMCGFVPASSITLESEDVVECIALWDSSLCIDTHAFGRRFYPKWIALHSMYIFDQFMHSLGICTYNAAGQRKHVLYTAEMEVCYNANTTAHSCRPGWHHNKWEFTIWDEAACLSRHNETESRIHEWLCVRYVRVLLSPALLFPMWEPQKTLMETRCWADHIHSRPALWLAEAGLACSLIGWGWAGCALIGWGWAGCALIGCCGSVPLSVIGRCLYANAVEF